MRGDRLLGGGTYLRLRSTPEEEDAAAPAGATALEVREASLESFTRRAHPVSGARVLRDTLWIRITASARAAAFRQATLSARVAGQVRDVMVRENDPVDADAFLVQMDTTEYALALARATASLTARRPNTTRSRSSTTRSPIPRCGRSGRASLGREAI